MRLSGRLKLFCIAVVLLSSFPAHAGDSSTEPMLRIESGEHTSIITGMAADKQGRYFVTVSEDKTARIWDASNGKPLNIFRSPVDDGSGGKLYAAAFSPDGTRVAIGGMPAEDRGIYIFDVHSGRLLRSIETDTLSQVMQLAYSSDGKTLAVLSAELFDAKLCLILAESGKSVDNCSSHSEGRKDVFFDFSPAGKLVKIGEDGLLSLYRFDGNRLKLLTRHAAQSGKHPVSARFSPDEKHIAVSFSDTAAIDVLGADTLNFEYSPDTEGVNAALSHLTWSVNGETLFAAGAAYQDINGNRKWYIRSWPGAGAGAAVNWPVVNGNITALASLPDGRLMFGTATPNWGVVNASGKVVIYHAIATARFPGAAGKVELSASGKTVRFSYGYGANPIVVFDTTTRAFLPGDVPGLMPPELTAPGMEITDWRNSKSAKLNGKAVPLYGDKMTREQVESDEMNETSRSLAVLPGDSGFVLGTSDSLRSYDNSGEERWVKDGVPGQVWAVNVSRDGRWIVAAYGDGTIRWHRANDGAELLAFFPHGDKKRWVMWTPQGYYDASGPDAEDLIGWHVNKGESEGAGFYPASSLHSEFYRPDVIQNVLNTVVPPPSLDVAASLISVQARAH